jgi:hypothetical protein
MGANVMVEGGTSKLAVRTLDTTDPPFLLPYTGAETLACQVWPGGALATLATPAAAWVVPATPTLSIALTPADVSMLPPGVYQFRVTATRAGVTGVVDRGTLEVLAAPSAGTLQLAFTTAADLIFYAPWIEDLETFSDLFGFNAQQVMATEDLIDDLCGLWKPQGFSAMPFSPDGRTYFMPGYSRDAPSRWLREQLVPLAPGATVPAAGRIYRLNSTPNYVRPAVSTALLLYPKVIEVCAKRALGYVFASQVGANTERSWKELACSFEADARRVFLTTRFQIDFGVPQTGNGYTVVDGANTSFR